MVELPAGSTPLDFAFAIHSDVGIHCLGAKSDGQIVPLDAELVNTQVVEILTSPQAHPNMNWLRIARTSKAKAKIRAWLVQAGEVLAIDRNIVAGGVHAGGPHAGAPHAAQATPAKPSPLRMTETVKAQGAQHGAIEYRAVEPGEAVSNDRAGVSIGGEKNLMIRIAGCCHPVTGDEIVGYVSRGRGIIVHRADCRSLHAIADFVERRVDVRWEEAAAFVTARIRVTARASPDLFAEIENALRKFHGPPSRGKAGRAGRREPGRSLHDGARVQGGPQEGGKGATGDPLDHGPRGGRLSAASGAGSRRPRRPRCWPFSWPRSSSRDAARAARRVWARPRAQESAQESAPRARFRTCTGPRARPSRAEYPSLASVATLGCAASEAGSSGDANLPTPRARAALAAGREGLFHADSRAPRAMHGDEQIGAELALTSPRTILAASGAGRDACSPPMDLTVIPVSNPWGYQQ